MLTVLRMCPIGKKAILGGDISTVQKLLKTAENELLTQGKVNPWNMTISGYDEDPRSLSQIPEVKDWFFKVHAFYPYLPLYLTQFILTPYLYSLLDVEVVGNQKRTDISRIEQNNIDNMVKISEKIKPGSGAELRNQLEYGYTYRVNQGSIQLMFAEISLAITTYLAAKGVSKTKMDEISPEAFERIRSSIRQIN